MQVSMAQALQSILVGLDNLERYVHDEISEARRNVIELLANCQPNVMMGNNEHYAIAPVKTLLDPAFKGSLPKGTGPTPQGLLALLPQRQFAIGLGLNLNFGDANDGPVTPPVQDPNFGDTPTIADNGPVAQAVQGLDPHNAPVFADYLPVAQPVQGFDFSNAPVFADYPPAAQPVQDFFGAGFLQASSGSPAKGQITCSDCRKTFNKNNWRRHLNQVHGEKPKVSCPSCGKSFTRNTTLRAHRCTTLG
ncbi:hypothetical protein EDB19DRAFT_953703 [Suillus lakei]|nr:hypothetical protein EDB19DRAFT_953703 [Suillus lakei]